jgi:hypothetical protein
MSQKQQKFSVTILHELNAAGQHRLVGVGSDGTNNPSEWVPQSQLLEHLGLWACADPSLGLPPVFSVREREHQVLA